MSYESRPAARATVASAAASPPDRRFSRGWPGVLAGDVVAFARGLRAQGYFTASAEAYAAGMRAPFAAALASGAFEMAADPRPEVDMGGPVHGTHVVDAALGRGET